MRYEYELERYRGMQTKHECPGCKHKKVFVRYINTNTGEYLSEDTGRCDREAKCGYHKKPKDYFFESRNSYQYGSAGGSKYTASTNGTSSTRCAKKTIDTLPLSILDKSVTDHQRSNLYPFLESLFGPTVASMLCEHYFIGASKNGNTAFWQADIHGRVRQVKVIAYDSITGHRRKDASIFYAGKKILKDSEANLQQCFFGEYILSIPGNQSKTIAIVESEKTAVIASVFYPKYIWLATGGIHGAKWTEKPVCEVLKGRRVVLFPDQGAYDTWKNKAAILASNAGCSVYVSDTIEKSATQDQEGWDLADFLLGGNEQGSIALNESGYPAIWDYYL